MLATVPGVANSVGHAHGRTCKVKSPAKAMLAVFQYRVWQHYFYFLFLCGFLWMFKDIFDMESPRARLKSSKMWVTSPQAVHKPIWTELSSQQLCLGKLPGFIQPGRAGGGRWTGVTWTQSHLQFLTVAEKFTGPAVLTFSTLNKIQWDPKVHVRC